METALTNSSSRRVAVLAVHGVGKHLAGETQTAVTDLLLSLPARNDYMKNRLYSPFHKVELEIPLQPLGVGQSIMNLVPPPQGAKRLLDAYQEPSAEFAKALGLGGGSPSDQDVALDYTQMLLQGYEGGADTNLYTTARLEGTRRSDGVEVDVYEVLWADLAKPDNTIYSFILDLFRLLVHLADLSSKAIDTGAGEGKGRLWELYRRMQRYAVRLFSIFVPLLEILLLISFLSCVPAIWLLTQHRFEVSIALGVLGAVAIGIGWILYSKRKISERPWVWALNRLSVIGLGALPAAVLWFLIGRCHNSYCDSNTADLANALFFWLVPGAMLMFVVCCAYGNSKKGVRLTGAIVFLLGFGAFCLFLYKAVHASIEQPVVQASFWTVQLVLAAVRFCWTAMIVAGVSAAILGSLAWRRMKKQGGNWGRARAAVRTSRFALALPTLLFMLVTLLIWRGMLRSIAFIANNQPVYSQSIIDKDSETWAKRPWNLFVPTTFPANPTTKTACCSNESNRNKRAVAPTVMPSDYATEALAWSFGYSLPWTLLCTLVATVLLGWWVLPSVLSEGVVPRGVDSPPRDCSDGVSLRMGTWMSRGLDAIAVSVWLLWAAVFAIPVLYLVVVSVYPGWNDFFTGITRTLVSNAFVGFAALAAIAKAGQTVLSTILDVDTYLRATPADATPRARIFERYVSMLRYLRDPKANQRDYKEIVIVAHSLGALISNDLLQYLESPRAEVEWGNKGAELGQPHFTSIPISLFTMGNPLRQLLNRFFPYLYGWVRREPDNGKSPLGEPALGAPKGIDAAASPDPTTLGVKRWVNAYRSGDYVGRSVWLDEWYKRPSFPTSTDPEVVYDPSKTRVEMCIGGGAHTRYMDDTAPDMAWMLDKMI